VQPMLTRPAGRFAFESVSFDNVANMNACIWFR
jgi:hypothetical protein